MAAVVSTRITNLQAVSPRLTASNNNAAANGIRANLAGQGTATPAIYGTGDTGPGVQGDSGPTADGVYGKAGGNASTYGCHGYSSTANAVGVFAENNSGGTGLLVAGFTQLAGGTLLKTTAALTNGAAGNVGTLTNAPAAGNPTKWLLIVDNGVNRYIPAW